MANNGAGHCLEKVRTTLTTVYSNPVNECWTTNARATHKQDNVASLEFVITSFSSVILFLLCTKCPSSNLAININFGHIYSTLFYVSIFKTLTNWPSSGSSYIKQRESNSPLPAQCCLFNGNFLGFLLHLFRLQDLLRYRFI